jgi:hypothetical protein
LILGPEAAVTHVLCKNIRREPEELNSKDTEGRAAQERFPGPRRRIIKTHLEPGNRFLTTLV